MEKLLRELIARRAEMAFTVFESPPSDWAAFQKRLGAFVELDDLIAIVTEAIKGIENDDT